MSRSALAVVVTFAVFVQPAHSQPASRDSIDKAKKMVLVKEWTATITRRMSVDTSTRGQGIVCSLKHKSSETMTFKLVHNRIYGTAKCWAGKGNAKVDVDHELKTEGGGSVIRETEKGSGDVAAEIEMCADPVTGEWFFSGGPTTGLTTSRRNVAQIPHVPTTDETNPSTFQLANLGFEIGQPKPAPGASGERSQLIKSLDQPSGCGNIAKHTIEQVWSFTPAGVVKPQAFIDPPPEAWIP